MTSLATTMTAGNAYLDTADRPGLPEMAEMVFDLSGFEVPLVREIAARMPVHRGSFTVMAPLTVNVVAVRHRTLGTHVVTCHLLLHRLHAGTGAHPVAIADLFAADQDSPAGRRPPLLGLLLLNPDPVLAQEWAVNPPDVVTVEDALDRWAAPSLVQVGTAMARAAHPAFMLGDDSDL